MWQKNQMGIGKHNKTVKQNPTFLKRWGFYIGVYSFFSEIRLPQQAFDVLVGRVLQDVVRGVQLLYLTVIDNQDAV